MNIEQSLSLTHSLPSLCNLHNRIRAECITFLSLNVYHITYEFISYHIISFTIFFLFFHRITSYQIYIVFLIDVTRQLNQIKIFKKKKSNVSHTKDAVDFFFTKHYLIDLKNLMQKIYFLFTDQIDKLFQGKKTKISYFLYGTIHFI